MDHGYFKDRLSAYLDGELTTEETRAIADHLESCEECRRHLSELKELDRLVAEHSGLEGDDYFEKAAQKIEQSLEEGTEVTDISGGSERRIRGLWWKVTSVAASAAVLVFIGLHQDDIFGPDDLVLPTESTSDKRTQEVNDSGELVLPASDETERESSPSEAGYRDDFEAAEEIAEEKVDQDVAKPTLVEKKEEPGSASAPAPVPMRESEEESDVLIEPMSMPTPVPPAAERARRGAATSAIGDQAPSGGVEDDNYQKSPDVAAGNVTPVESYLEEESLDEDMVIDIEGQDYQPSRDLSYWVRRCDSLKALTVADSPAGKAKRILQSVGTNSLAPKPSVPETGQNLDEIEADLLEAWCWIARLTEEAAEEAHARGELERVAKDSSSANRHLAGEYLRRLGGK